MNEIRPQVSIRMDGARQAEVIRVTLAGRTLTLRSGLLASVAVNVDDLRKAIDMLEASVPDACPDDERDALRRATAEVVHREAEWLARHSAAAPVDGDEA